ncbi:MAG: Gfo/Idh/MocA family oxidoreductase [Phycisphaerales bacterium]|nr:Gfo/Idh/MocA family oxidoreductase [Phycisphaerales bacterium]
MSSSNPVRVGLVGTGAISQVVHVPILSEREDVEFVALADRDPHKARALADRFGVGRVMDAEAMIVSDELDAVFLCTPNDLHEEMAVGALRSGKHVFVERPLAPTSEGAARVVQAARDSDRLLAVGMPHRFRPEVSALRSFVAGGELGDLYAVRGSWMTRPVATSRPGWRQQRKTAGGGALVELGIPALDLCMWLMGFPEIKRISCVVSKGDYEVEDAASLMAETVDGVALTLEVSTRLFSGDDRYFAQVLGREGSGSLLPLEVYKQLGGRPLEVTPRQPRPRGGENPYTNAYRRLIDEFIRGVGGRSGILRLPEEQVRLMALVEAAYKAAETGREVHL